MLGIFVTNLRNDDADVVKIMEIFLKSGLSVNELSYGSSSLHWSVAANNVTLTNYLLDKGADLSMKMEHLFDVSPLGKAVLNNFCDIAKILLSRGANVSEKDSICRSPLHFACLSNHEEMIKLLIKNGAYISAKDKEGHTPFSNLDATEENFHRCQNYFIKEFAKIFIEGHSITDQDSQSIESNSNLKELLANCMNELEDMKKTKLFFSFNSYQILNKSIGIKKLARLLHNDDNIVKIKELIENLRFYNEHLQSILEEALQEKTDYYITCSKLNDIFRNFLPAVVKRKLADSLNAKDLP